MADPFAAASTIVGLMTTAEKISQSLLRFTDKRTEIERTSLEVSSSLQKVRVWQDNWSGHGNNPNISPSTLWGEPGWAKIQTLLLEIVNKSTDIEQLLRELEESQRTQSTLRWKRAVERIGKRTSGHRQKDLKDLAAALNKSADELWIFSETVFDSLHGLLAFKTKLTGRDNLLVSALQTRAGSLRLYDLCLNQVEDFNLELNLDGDGTMSKVLQARMAQPLAICYHLVTEPREKELQKLTVKDVEKSDISKGDLDTMDETGGQDFRLFPPGPGSSIVEIPQYGIGPIHYLHISRQLPGTVRLKSDPESLANIMRKLKHNVENHKFLALEENFDLEARVKLAFNVIKSGFVLLGTPWFSSLNSKNIRRCTPFDEQSSAFILRTQTLELKDLVSDDPGALAETSQLFRLGVLLMEIALATPDTDATTDQLEHDPIRISKLPLVERTMGVQYCTATAFCLRYRQRCFAGPGKYDSKRSANWGAYLAELLEEYYSEVFLRIQDLSEIVAHTDI